MKILATCALLLVLSACGPGTAPEQAETPVAPPASPGETISRSEGTTQMCKVFSDEEVQAAIGADGYSKEDSTDNETDKGGCFAESATGRARWGIATGSVEDLSTVNIPDADIDVDSQCPGYVRVQANEVEARVICDLGDGSVFMVLQNVWAGVGDADRDETIDLLEKGLERIQ